MSHCTTVATSCGQLPLRAFVWIPVEGGSTVLRRCSAVWGLRAAAHVHGTPSSGVEMMLKEDSSANIVTPKWALEMGRNLPLVKPADRADGKVRKGNGGLSLCSMPHVRLVGACRHYTNEE